ncbi:MAG: threonine/serine dehydratase [Alicyclobacillus macrosporangiidus]|uniref:threonine ammonia-lyase n=1 Tax=Alicyclobacillus macrosporangiidus TaxID=392015 RepID=UPI0026EA6FB4|nr:threonine/serine dehydratase [Alicyclobacillus macrosporangiidus]MCL6600692.1 threonine/serine dehydratase [Alicyclobacillus macrosporangiidus]
MTQHPEVTWEDIVAASRRIVPYAVRTPLLYAQTLSRLAGTDVYLKCENLQRTGAFKVRGALNMVLALREQPNPPRGVITASSGNHGQAVAYAASLVGLPCTVVVPETVMPVKERAIQGYGARVIRCGTMSSQRIERAEQLAREEGLAFVPPYDHPWVVAGQGTAGLEIAEDLPGVRTVFVPVGGGGLASGVATALKARIPEVRVVGVEPELANDTYLSLQAGHPVDIGETKTIADGLRTNHPGHYTFPIVQKRVDAIALVSEDTIRTAVVQLLESCKILVEPSGATSVAAVIAAAERGEALDGPVVCVLSGGNMELSMLAEWLG